MAQAESDFYVEHYGGLLPLGATSLDVFDKEMLQEGKRYSLVLDDFKAGFSGRNIVELGCGGAEALLILSQLFPNRAWTGLDISVAPAIFGSVEVKQANLNEQWPFREQSVDGLIAMMVIEHLFNPYFSFAEIKRVLSPNGRAWVNLPLVTSVQNRARLLLGRLPETSVPYGEWAKSKSWDGMHLHYFSVSSIRDLANQAGLTVSEIRAVGNHHELKSRFPSLLASEITFSLEHI